MSRGAGPRIGRRPASPPTGTARERRDPVNRTAFCPGMVQRREATGGGRRTRSSAEDRGIPAAPGSLGRRARIVQPGLTSPPESPGARSDPEAP